MSFERVNDVGDHKHCNMLQDLEHKSGGYKNDSIFFIGNNLS